MTSQKRNNGGSMHFRRDESLSRKRKADPFYDKPMEERLKDAEAIDLRDNFRTEDLGGGYGRIVPIDETKRFRHEE